MPDTASKALAQHVVKALHESGEWTPQSYSGRAMYGKRCVGVTVSAQQMFLVVGYLMKIACLPEDGDAWDEAFLDVLRNTRSDNMGLDMIVYWPSLEWDPAWNDLGVEEEDEDE